MPRLIGYSKSVSFAGTLDDGLSRFAESQGDKDEFPNEVCSSFSSSQGESGFFNNLHTSYSDALNQSDLSGENRLLQTWKQNYHEAAIYMQVTTRFTVQKQPKIDWVQRLIFELDSIFSI